MKSTVCIIGGGPSGLALAKALAEENIFQKIDVYEKSHQTGGVWNFSPKKSDHARFVPSVDPIDFSHLDAVEYSPMYRHLETNLNYRLMQFNGVEFPPGTVDNPDRTEVLEYIKKYQTTLPKNKNISLNFDTPVIDVSKKNEFWQVIVEKNGVLVHLFYEFLVICSGHYSYPFIPDVPGLKEWWENDKNSVIHSKDYVDCEAYLGKKVLVVGNGFSGIDLSVQISETSQRPVIVSGKHQSMQDLPIDGVINEVGEVARYDYHSRSAILIDGTIIADIDQIIFSTGYLYAYPFLKSLLESTVHTDDALLLHNGQRVRRLYKQVFYIPDPTLSFVGLQKSVVPMPLAECQGAVIARVYSGRLKLPDEQIMREYEKKEVQERSPESKYHVFQTPEDMDYYDMLIDWANESSDPDNGFKAERWTEERRALRNNSAADKTKSLTELVREINKKRKKRGLVQ